MSDFFIKASWLPRNEPIDILAYRLLNMLEKIYDYGQGMFENFYGNFNEFGQYDRGSVIGVSYESIHKYLTEIPTNWILDRFVGYDCGFYTNANNEGIFKISCTFENHLSNQDLIHIQINSCNLDMLSNMETILNMMKSLVDIWNPNYCVFYPYIGNEYIDRNIIGYITYFKERIDIVFNNIENDNFNIIDNNYIFLNENLLSNMEKIKGEIININSKINIPHHM